MKISLKFAAKLRLTYKTPRKLIIYLIFVFTMDDIHNSVREYYGKILQKSNDLKTNACVTSGKPPKHIRDVLSLIHEEVESKYYGCGLVIPSVLEGMRILDLGSGSGRDCFILSKLVGEKGYVVGVDMTKEQIETARKYIEYHTTKFGYAKPNIEFREGYIEHLQDLGFQDNSFDIVM
jgi:arsenite methyltransferase